MRFAGLVIKCVSQRDIVISSNNVPGPGLPQLGCEPQPAHREGCPGSRGPSWPRVLSWSRLYKKVSEKSSITGVKVDVKPGSDDDRLTGHSPICMVAILPPSLFLASRSLKSLKPFLAR